MMEENEYRNPSPPPLTESEKEIISADNIGETLFSRSWVLSVLLKLYKHNNDEIYDDENPELDTEEANSNFTLRAKFEKDVCELWDSSANSEVATFVLENQGKDIFLDVLDKTLSPRLVEIIFGIVGNLVCVDDINIDLSQDAAFRTSMLGYLGISDALSLVELTRLLNVCLVHSETSYLWMRSVKKCSAVEDLVATLGNSLNVQLLEHVIQLILTIFDSSDTLLVRYGNASLFCAVTECYNVIRCKSEELVEDLLYILQLVSISEKGVQQLAEDGCVFLLLKQCIVDERNLFVEKKPALLGCVFSVLACLLFAKPIEMTILIDDHIDVLECLIIALHLRIVKHSDTDDEFVPVFLEVFHNICQTFATYKDSGNFANIVSQLQENESTIKEVLEKCNRKNTPVEWKKHVMSLLELNKQYHMLNVNIVVN